ncbi:MAG: aspartate dehydrogenase [Burkholderiaceae bacterium]|nr:aspartate dehydrogenase [Burkholderiaceae bacterium]
MTPRRVGLIGWGSIGQTLLQAWARQPVPGHQAAALLLRPAQLQAAREAQARNELPPGLLPMDDAAAFLAAPLDLVVEAAGQGAVRELGEAVLRSGRDLMLLSVGALTDDALRERLQAAAVQAGVRLLLPVGAIAGLDGLLALRQAGLRQLTYTSTKPPLAWKGTPAEQAVDLDALSVPTCFFSGTAREAAARFPKNANLAATVALAGLGLDRTRVELIADPGATGNRGQIEALGDDSRLSITVAGLGSASNPKSSRITGLSVLSALANGASPLGYV